MSKNYSQLSKEQRYQIEALIAAGKTQTKIAEIIKCHPSTVSREIRRNTPLRGYGAALYRAKNAQRRTDLRHAEKNKQIIFTDQYKVQVKKWLENDKLSPELIAVEGKMCFGRFVSAEWIYQWIWRCKKENRFAERGYKKLYKHLKHGRRRRKRGIRRDKRGIIHNRVSIEQRPRIVNKRRRFGDIEVDLLIGRKHKQAIAVMTDRATLVTHIAKVITKDSTLIAKAITRKLNIYKGQLKTITFDNDQAFSKHDTIAKKLKVASYFTRPYTAQDKGTVENRIWQLRRFIPKKTDLSLISFERLKQIENKLNNRRVRKFNYKTPLQMLSEKIALIS
jgi:transposase, IS30 family